MARRSRQTELQFRTWGGKRRGAGRKRVHSVASLPHRARPLLEGQRHPVHLTLTMRKEVWNLRSRRCFRVIERAFILSNQRATVRIVHYAVQGNHVHLIAEAQNERALTNGVRALAIRMAKGLNRVMGRSGRLFADRYHEHILRTLLEVRRAVQYVLQNSAKHFGLRVLDPFCSVALFFRRGTMIACPPDPRTITRPSTWLLRHAPT